MLKKIKISYDAFWLLALMWGLFLLEWILPINFGMFHLTPRTLSSLPGILTFNVLHHGLWHIIANSLPFVILGCVIQLYGRKTYWFATAVICLVGGLGAWLFSADGRIAGASGLVFGYWSFLLSSAYFLRSLKALAIAFVVFIFYGSMFFGLLDMRSHISWAGHFWGLIGGIVAAYWSMSALRLSAKPSNSVP